MTSEIRLILIFTIATARFYCQDSKLFESGKNEFMAGNYSKAIENLLQAKKIAQEKDLNYFIAMSYFNLKEYKKSISFFSLDLKGNSKNINSYMQRSKAYKKTGHYKAAVLDLKKILKINKDYYLAYYEEGDINYEQKKYRQAIVNYMKALVINPKLEKAFYKTGFCYLNLKDTLAACTSWSKLEDPDDFEEYQRIEKICKSNLK